MSMPSEPGLDDTMLSHDADVGGTALAITLTTGESLTSHQHGDQFHFHSRHNANGAVTIAVDSMSPLDIRKADGQGGGTPLSGGDITDDDPVLVIYDSHANVYFLGVARAGRAATHNLGTTQHDVPVLQSGGALHDDIITQSGLALLDGPDFTGNPTAPTPTDGDDSTSLATTAFVLANAGTDSGFTLRYGTGNPGSGLGDDGDWYINTNDGSFHEKVSGTWHTRYTDQVGDDGFALRHGTGNPANSLGDNNDWYLNTTDGSLHQKVSGTWHTRYTDQVGGSGGLTQAEVDARVRSVGALAHVGASYLGPSRTLAFSRLGGGIDNLSLATAIHIFHGVGGVSFITSETFEFGDTCIIGDFLYLFSHTVQTSHSPSTVPTSSHFARLPLIVSGGHLSNSVIPPLTTSEVTDDASITIGGCLR